MITFLMVYVEELISNHKENDVRLSNNEHKRI